MLVRKYVLAERSAQCREAFDDFRKALLGRAIKGCAGAAKGSVIALQHALLFGVEAERIDVLHQRIDAEEQVRVGVDVVPMAGSPRRKVAFDLQKRFVAVGADEEMEN